MRKMVVRADDVGYTLVNNIGAFESIEKGVVTAADVMLDSPGTVDALERLKNYPWISIGWHPHFWCSPVLPANEVKSLIIPGTGRFRHDLHTAEDIDLSEAYAECKAQMELCMSILGRAPDTMDHQHRGPFDDIIMKVADEYGIVHSFALKDGREPLPKYADRKIVVLHPGPAYDALLTESVDEVEKYDPAMYYIEDRSGILNYPEDVITTQSWHPGYLDYFNYRCGDYGPRANRFTLGRIKDVEALTSDRLKNWIKENEIELINFRDAIYGTSEYQNHLRHIGSDLYMGK